MGRNGNSWYDRVIEDESMKRLVIFLSALLVLTIAILLQLDVIALFRLSLAGIYDAPTTMYFMWIMPAFFNVGYEALKDSLFIILLVSDVFLLISAVLVYHGLTVDSTPEYQKYHF